MNAACACTTRNSLVAVVIFLVLAVVASGCGGTPLPTPAGPVDVSVAVTTPAAGATPTPVAGATPAPHAPATPLEQPANPRACHGTIEGRAVDEVEVPHGAFCWLRGVDVNGNVRVGASAVLNAVGVLIDGNLEADGAESVNLVSISVEGNIEVRRQPLTTTARTFSAWK